MNYQKDCTLSSLLSEYDNVPRGITPNTSRTVFDPTCELTSKIKSNDQQQNKRKNSFRTPPKRFKFPIEEEQPIPEVKDIENGTFFLKNSPISVPTLEYRSTASQLRLDLLLKLIT